MDFSFLPESGLTAIDIETTGLSPRRCKIVEIAALKRLPDGRTEEFATLVDPRVRIPPSSTAIHGITDAMVKGAPTADEAAARLLEFVGESHIAAHNAKFDLGFLTPIVKALRREWQSPAAFDTVRIARLAYPGLKSYSLENLSAFLDFERGGHHRALADCAYCEQLFSMAYARLRPADFATFARDNSESPALLGREE